MTEQAVTEPTDPPAVPDGEASGEQDLNALLSEFESTPEPPKRDDPPKDDQNEVLTFIREQKAKSERESTDKDINEAVTLAKGDFDLPDWVVKGALMAKADEEPRFRQAWVTRHQNPQAFAGIARAIGVELAKDMSIKLDKNTTESRTAAMEAVRGQSESAPKPKNTAEEIRDIPSGQAWQEHREKVLRGR